MPPLLAVEAGVDRADGGPPRAKAAQGLHGLLRQIPPPRPGFPSQSLHVGAMPPVRGGAPSFSPNTITVAAVFAAVCEGYLGMMPH